MTVGIVGTGPAIEAIEAAMSDVDHSPIQCEIDDIPNHELAVVVGVTGSTVFETANNLALESETSWIAVELGGIGGYPVVKGAITGFSPETICYECLQSRVRANVDPGQRPTEAPPPATARFAGAIAGREAVSTFQAFRHDVMGYVTEIPYTRRRLLAVPHCGCGSNLSREIEPTHIERPVEEVLGSASDGIDERVGIVRDVGEIESFPVPYYLVQNGDTYGFSDVSALSRGTGVATDWNEAMMAALSEGYKRYCCGVYRREDFREASVEKVDSPIRPSSFVTPEEPEGPYDWVEGINLATEKPVDVPVSVVVHPLESEPIRPGSTAGLGFGNETVEAMISGLYDVIARDAGMIGWYSTFEPLGVTIEDERFEELRRRVQSEGLSVTPILLTQDVDVPVVGCALHREDGWPRISFGMSANLDPIEAARSALRSATRTWLDLRRRGGANAAGIDGAIADYAEFPSGLNEFIETQSTVQIEDVGPEIFPTGEAELESVVERLTEEDLTPVAVRLTTTDIETLGFEVVRILVPSAQPQFVETPYFGDRIETVPEQLGFESRLDRDIHPFDIR